MKRCTLVKGAAKYFSYFYTFLIIEFTDIVDNAIAPFYYPPQFTGDIGLSEAKTH
jgi:hypothetical protein